MAPAAFEGVDDEGIVIWAAVARRGATVAMIRCDTNHVAYT